VSKFPSSKANRVYAALLRIGWTPKPSKSGSHIQMQKQGFPDFTWAWHDSVELGPIAIKKIARLSGLKPEDL
jgi:predicted RNA binding protein YcfA (HicA-like mRNA interferase family)